MAGKKDKDPAGKRQASFYVDAALIKRLDRWLEGRAKRGHDTDRSFVVNVLLRRFLDKNAPEERAAKES